MFGDEHVVQDLAFVADDERAVVDAEGAVGFEFFGVFGLDAAVVPDDFDGAVVGGGGELEAGDGGERGGFLADGVGLLPVAAGGFDDGGEAELEGEERGEELVAADVTEDTAAKVPPAWPGEGEVGGMIGAMGEGPTQRSQSR